VLASEDVTGGSPKWPVSLVGSLRGCEGPCENHSGWLHLREALPLWTVDMWVA